MLIFCEIKTYIARELYCIRFFFYSYCFFWHKKESINGNPAS
jgi:hypothetical protein